MDPIAESKWFYRWQATDLPAEATADPSLRQLRESRLRMGLLLQKQSEETRSLLLREANRIAADLGAGKAVIRFHFPEGIVLPEDQAGKCRAIDVPVDFREQKISGFLDRFRMGDARAAFRSRLSQLENSGYFGVQTCSSLLRFAVAREMVHALPAAEMIAGLPGGITETGPDLPSPENAVWVWPRTAPDDPDETKILKSAEAAMLRLRDGVNSLHQAVSLAPYMYADEEYQSKRGVLLIRLVSLGHALAHREVRGMVRRIWRRAQAQELNRGLSLSVPFFDDRSLELKLHEFEVIPPGRTMFVPAFVALAAAREQEKVGQEKYLSPSARVHLLAELEDLERAFDGRPR
jgi:hypothetical protein